MGYAISINDVLPIIKVLSDGSAVIRPSIGATFQTVDSGIAAVFGLGVNKGALITGIATTGPADKAGIKKGDVITNFGDTAISTERELRRAINASKVGQAIQVTFWHSKDLQVATIMLSVSTAPKR